MTTSTAPIFAACLLFFAAIAAAAPTPGDQRVSARLLADVPSIRPGDSFNVGLLLDIDPGWHIYWKNPGDSGMATRVTLDLPPGLTAGLVRYPTPTFLHLPGDILNYAYEKQVMLIVPVTVASSLPRENCWAVVINADVHWLVCNKDVCLPGSASVTLSVPVSPGPSSERNSLFADWDAKMPRHVDPANVAAIERQIDLQPTASGSAGRASIAVNWKTPPQSIDFFPGLCAGFDVTDPRVQTHDGKTIASFKLASESKTPLPQTIDCVLAYTNAAGDRLSLDVPLTAADQQHVAMSKQ